MTFPIALTRAQLIRSGQLVPAREPGSWIPNRIINRLVARGAAVLRMRPRDTRDVRRHISHGAHGAIEFQFIEQDPAVQFVIELAGRDLPDEEDDDNI